MKEEKLTKEEEALLIKMREARRNGKVPPYEEVVEYIHILLKKERIEEDRK